MKRPKKEARQVHRMMVNLTPEEHAALVKSSGAFKPATWARYLIVLGMKTTTAPELPKAA